MSLPAPDALLRPPERHRRARPRAMVVVTSVAVAASTLACLGVRPTLKNLDKNAARDRLAARVFATRCVTCHMLDGDGGKEGPDLTHEGQKHDAAWLARWITNPSDVDPIADMPAFGGKISTAELTAISNYLAGRK